jgi:hypothetical protein
MFLNINHVSHRPHQGRFCSAPAAAVAPAPTRLAPEVGGSTFRLKPAASAAFWKACACKRGSLFLRPARVKGLQPIRTRKCYACYELSVHPINMYENSKQIRTCQDERSSKCQMASWPFCFCCASGNHKQLYI